MPETACTAVAGIAARHVAAAAPAQAPGVGPGRAPRATRRPSRPRPPRRDEERRERRRDPEALGDDDGVEPQRVRWSASKSIHKSVV